MNKFYIFLLITVCATNSIVASDKQEMHTQKSKDALTAEQIEQIRKAPFKEHEKMFRTALANGNAVSCPSFFTILMSVSENADKHSIFQWLNDYPNSLVTENVNTRNKNGFTLLRLYVTRPPSFYSHPVTQGFAKPPELKRLLDLKANVDAVSSLGLTPLEMVASQHNNLIFYNKHLIAGSLLIAANGQAMQSYRFVHLQLEIAISNKNNQKVWQQR